MLLHLDNGAAMSQQSVFVMASFTYVHRFPVHLCIVLLRHKLSIIACLAGLASQQTALAPGACWVPLVSIFHQLISAATHQLFRAGYKHKMMEYYNKQLVNVIIHFSISTRSLMQTY